MFVAMTEFPEYLIEKAVAGLHDTPEGERADVYAVSFFVYDEDDEPERPVVTVGTNTEARVQFALHPPEDFALPNPWWKPSDELEARWNYAFWLQNRLAVIADSRTDPEGAALRDAWVRAQGVSPDDITEAFVGLCVDTVQRLHADGTVESVFGRPIPVIVHELEYYDAIVDQNVAANGHDLAAGLAAWVASM